MTILKRLALSAAIGLIAAGTAQAREMRVSSFEPAQGFYSAQILQAWIDQVNPQLSTGNAFRLYPGAMLGAPGAQAELVRAGVADVALVVPTYTPGLFPMSGVVELPGIAQTATQGTEVLNTLAEEGALAAEYADYKIIALFTTPGYRFFMTGGGTEGPGDLQGVRLRTPSSFGTHLLEMMGASGVSIPAPQVYENLERGVVSGAVWVFDAYRTFRLDEVAPYVTTTRITASPMAILMNRATYEALPEGDRAAIDAFAGRTAAEWVAGVVDTADAALEQSFREAGNVRFIDLDEAAEAAWMTALAAAPEDWVARQPDADAARAVLERAQSVAAETAGE